MLKLENKVALVTGGSRGIGRAIAEALASEGARIGLTYVTNKDKAEQNCRRISDQYGVKSIAIKADVASAGEAEQMANTMLQEFGRIDILVNNAGIVTRKALLELSPEEWNTIITTNLSGVFHCTKSVLPAMVTQKWGRIINIGSTLVFIGVPEQSAYAAAKGGVIAFTKAIARELAPYGINVNCVAPGATQVERPNAPEDWQKAWDAAASASPLGRFLRPEEVARSVVFLASPDGDTYIGQTICPNGGEFML